MEVKTRTTDVKSEDSGAISGYAATFTHEQPDSYGDVIAKGAFAESIAEIESSGKKLPLLWNHDSGDIGAYIGTITKLQEDDHGLYFEAIFDDTDEAQRVRQLAQDGRICKLSFAYNVLDAGTVTLEDGREANELRKLEIYEVSLVMYPANPDTSVLEVKGVKAGRRNSAKDADDLNHIKELCGSIESIVNGLLADAREEPDGQEPEPEEDEAKANAEEPDTANAEEPEAKSAEVEALLQQANEILTQKEG